MGEIPCFKDHFSGILATNLNEVYIIMGFDNFAVHFLHKPILHARLAFMDVSNTKNMLIPKIYPCPPSALVKDISRDKYPIYRQLRAANSSGAITLGPQ